MYQVTHAGFLIHLLHRYSDIQIDVWLPRGSQITVISVLGPNDCCVIVNETLMQWSSITGSSNCKAILDLSTPGTLCGRVMAKLCAR